MVAIIGEFERRYDAKNKRMMLTLLQIQLDNNNGPTSATWQTFRR